MKKNENEKKMMQEMKTKTKKIKKQKIYFQLFQSLASRASHNLRLTWRRHLKIGSEHNFPTNLHWYDGRW